MRKYKMKTKSIPVERLRELLLYFPEEGAFEWKDKGG